MLCSWSYFYKHPKFPGKLNRVWTLQACSFAVLTPPRAHTLREETLAYPWNLLLSLTKRFTSLLGYLIIFPQLYWIHKTVLKIFPSKQCLKSSSLCNKLSFVTLSSVHFIKLGNLQNAALYSPTVRQVSKSVRRNMSLYYVNVYRLFGGPTMPSKIYCIASRRNEPFIKISKLSLLLYMQCTVECAERAWEGE